MHTNEEIVNQIRSIVLDLEMCKRQVESLMSLFEGPENHQDHDDHGDHGNHRDHQ
jgi:hypothetical protein